MVGSRNTFWIISGFIRNAATGSTLDRLPEKFEQNNGEGTGMHDLLSRGWDAKGQIYSVSKLPSSPLGADLTSRVLEEPNKTFLWFVEYFYKSDHMCKMSVPWKTQYPNHLSFGFPKESPLRPFFFYQSIKLYENGAVNVLKKRYLEDTRQCVVEKDMSLGIEKLIGVFVLYGIGIILTSISLFLEFTTKPKVEADTESETLGSVYTMFGVRGPEQKAKLNEELLKLYQIWKSKNEKGVHVQSYWVTDNFESTKL